MSLSKKIRVLVVDDSAIMRQLLTQILNSDPDIEVVDTAEDAFDAREKIKLHNPDVLTLDIEMPKMDGLTFLEKIMTLRPMPVVMISTLTEKGANATFRALEIGAVDYVAKPNQESALSFKELGHEICQKVKVASKASMTAKNSLKAATAGSGKAGPVVSRKVNKYIIAIGASTGGVDALTRLISSLSRDMPPILVAQHMPAGFTKNFAQRLSARVALDVVEAVDQQRIEPNTVYVAPGGLHMEIQRQGDGYITRLTDNPPVNGHRPSVEVLFESFVRVCPEKTIAAILTGMGKDGAEGLKHLKEAGAVATLGQDEHSCLVYGMPKVAKAIGALTKELPLDDIGPALMALCSK